MTRARRRVPFAAALAFFCLLLAGPVAMAAPERRSAADRLAQRFAAICYDHAGDLAATRALLRRKPFRPVPPDRAAALLRRPGLAFAVPDDPGSPVLLSFDDGWCGAGDDGIDPQALTLALASAVERRGGRMELMDAGAAGDEQHYLLHRPGTAAPMVLLVLLQDRGGGVVQATLFSAPMPADPPASPNGSPP